MAEDWRAERASGTLAILIAAALAGGLWLAIWRWGPDLPGEGDLTARLVFAAKALAICALFTLVAGVEAVAHERLQSAAFDPLNGPQSRRLQVNQRYLQNTLEQFVIFAIAVIGLAIYAETASARRALLALLVVWVLCRWAFWIGYHRSVALRGLGMPGMMAAFLALLYVAVRAGHDAAGVWGAALVIGGFAALEALLFLKTRS